MTWQDIPGWYDFEATYREAVHRFPNGSTFVEVGCYLGRSLIHLAQLAREANKWFQIIGVDTCRESGVENGHDHHADVVENGGGSFVGQLHRNIVQCGFADDISLIVGSSLQAAAMFSPRSLYFVFIDAAHDYDSVAAHDYDSVRSDIAAWLPNVKTGGVIAGDDYGIPNEVNPVWPGVKQAVSHLLPGHECRPHDAWWYEVR